MELDIAIILMFLVANLAVGIITSRKIYTLDHFSVGSRSFSTFAITATLSASFIGGGYTMGNVSKVYQMGMVYAFALLGFSLKEMLVATIIAPRMDPFRDCLSIGDMIQKRYGLIPKIVTGIFAITICAGILGAQVGAMGAIFSTFFNFSPFWGILIGFSVIIFYSTLGGMRAVVYTDILQFLILIVGIPATFFVALHHIGGWDQVMTKIPYHHVMFLQSGDDWLFFVTLFITFIFGETLVPPYVQRLFMAKSSKHTRNATLYSGLLSIPFFIVVGAIGLLARWFNPDIDPNNALPYVVQTQMPTLIRGFVIAGIFSVIMSSAAGFLNAGAVSFVNDIVKPCSRGGISQKRLVFLAKLSTVIIGVGAVIFALLIHNVLDILLIAYHFWAPIILVPLVAIILGYQSIPRDFAAGATVGGLMMIIWTWYLAEPHGVSGVVVGVFANFLAFTASYTLRQIKEKSPITEIVQ